MWVDGRREGMAREDSLSYIVFGFRNWAYGRRVGSDMKETLKSAPAKGNQKYVFTLK